MQMGKGLGNVSDLRAELAMSRKLVETALQFPWSNDDMKEMLMQIWFFSFKILSENVQQNHLASVSEIYEIQN